MAETKKGKKSTSKQTSTKKRKQVNSKPTKKQMANWNQTDQMKLVLAGLLILMILVVGIYSLVSKKDDQAPNPATGLVIEKENEGKFQLANIQNGTNTTITFKVENKSSEKKAYNLIVSEIQNELVDPTKCTYNLFINNQQEIFDEIFPSEDMLLIDGAEVNANDNLEFKIVIQYHNSESSEDFGKSLSGKLDVREDTNTY